MAHKKRKRTLVTTLSILAVLLVAVGTVALIRTLSPGKEDPYVQQEQVSQENDANQGVETPDNGQNQTNQQQSSESTSGEPALDLARVATVDIVPMDITVSYVKGIGGFEYEVLRANNGTRYVEFRSPQLIGTKCTNDAGTFASILASPTEGERGTLTKTTTVDGTTYGLSLADATCTSDTAKLQSYQKSFSDAFSLLKNID